MTTNTGQLPSIKIWSCDYGERWMLELEILVFKSLFPVHCNFKWLLSDQL